MESANHEITSLAFTSSVTDPAFGVTEDGQVFLGHGPEEFEDRAWIPFGRLVGPLVLGRPMQVAMTDHVTTTSAVIATQRLPVTIAV